MGRIRDRDVVSQHARAENGFRARRYSHGHIGRAGAAGREAKTAQRIERQMFQVDMRRSAANESETESIGR
jgi:hypothetical protein